MERVLARLLRHQAELGAGLGLDADDQLVGVGDHPPADPEPRRALEDDPDLGRLDRHRLAGADEERHAGPAPVVDLEPQGDEGLGLRVGRDALDLAVAAVLAADVAARVGRGHRPEEVGLAVADRVGVGGARRGRLHRDQREHLQEVVLDHVAQRADRVVEAAAVLDPEVLGHRDLDRVDVAGGSRPAPGSCSRTAGRGCPSPAPCRGSGRCAGSATRRAPRGARR